MTRLSGLVFAITVMASLIWGGVSCARGQCEPAWQPFDPSTASIPGLDGPVHAIVSWDPDASGPQPTRLVVGGWFTIAGGGFAQNIAQFDPETGQWSAMGAGLRNGALAGNGVLALAVLPNGDLIAAGDFRSSGQASVNNIVRWNGSGWSPFGSGTNGAVYALAVLPNGDLVAGGGFTSAGGGAASNIARWDGSNWAPLGSGMNGQVLSLTIMPNGNVVAGGLFASAGGVSASRIARWNGSEWSPFGSGISGISVAALAVLPNGNLVAGGDFSAAGGVGVSNVARWNGSAWSAMGAQMDSKVNVLRVLSDGTLVAGGRTQSSATAMNNIARWTGSVWSRLGSGVSGEVHSLGILPNGDLIAGGAFATASGVSASRVARWNGVTWSRLGRGLDGGVNALRVLGNGDLVVGGGFVSVGDVPAARIARWNGSSWLPLGSGMAGTLFPTVNALAVMPNGDLMAGGGFLTAGGVSVNRVARWNGLTWSALTQGLTSVEVDPVFVNALAVLPNGDLVAGGNFTEVGLQRVSRIARWNGSAWSPLGSGVGGNVFPAVRALTVMPNGDLVAGGNFPAAGGVTVNNIARWNGSAWSALGSGFNGLLLNVYALAVLPNGDLVAGGDFSGFLNRIARWNGSAWTQMGSGMNGSVFALAVLPNGDLVAGGVFTTAGGVNALRIARWDGNAWRPFGEGMSGQVSALAVLPNGELVAGGSFVTAGGVFAPYLARWGLPRVVVTDQPDAATINAGQSLTLAATVNPGIAGVSVQWRRNEANIANGAGGGVGRGRPCQWRGGCPRVADDRCVGDADDQRCEAER